MTDNALNINALTSALSWVERACFTQTLHLVISDAAHMTSGFFALFKKARSIVEHYKESVEIHERVNSFHKKLNTAFTGVYNKLCIFFQNFWKCVLWIPFLFGVLLRESSVDTDYFLFFN